MTAQEMHYEFKLRYNEVDTQDRKDLNPAEIDAFLTDAALIKAKMLYRTAEQTQANMDALATLLVYSPTTEQPVVGNQVAVNNVYEFKTSDFAFTYMHLYRADISVSECSDNLPLVIIQQDDLAHKLTNFHTKPSLKWRRAIGVIGRSSDGTGESIYVHTKGEYTVNGMYPVYLKVPNEITIGGYIGIDGISRTATNCDLPEYIHTEVVDLAVQNALGIVALPHEYQIAQLKTQVNQN